MAGRIDNAQKEQLKEAGQWEAFLRRRDELKARGFAPDDARDIAFDQVMRGDTDSDSAEPIDVDSLPTAPPELAGKKAAEPEIVRWVARHIDHPDPDPAECPDPFAWTLLRACRDRERGSAFLVFFVEKLWAKLIPTRSQLDGGGAKVVDGKPTIELYDRILSMKAEAEAGCGLAETAQAEGRDAGEGFALAGRDAPPDPRIWR